MTIDERKLPPATGVTLHRDRSRSLWRRFLVWMGLGLALTGCGLGWDDVPTAEVRPSVSDPALLEQWDREIRRAVDDWGNHLTYYFPECERPFVVVAEGGHRIELVPTAEWTYDPRVAGVTWCGEAVEERIEIRADADAQWEHQPPLIHELGHAIGLNHADRAFGPSVMTSSPTSPWPMPRDIAAAACHLGCGPCDDNADPYDGG